MIPCSHTLPVSSPPMFQWNGCPKSPVLSRERSSSSLQKDMVGKCTALADNDLAPRLRSAEPIMSLAVGDECEKMCIMMERLDNFISLEDLPEEATRHGFQISFEIVANRYCKN